MEWISVKDRMPSEGKFVLFYEKYTDLPVIGFLRNGEWHADKSAFDATQGGLIDFIESREVTHWMPLPELPEEN